MEQNHFPGNVQQPQQPPPQAAPSDTKESTCCRVDSTFESGDGVNARREANRAKRVKKKEAKTRRRLESTTQEQEKCSKQTHWVAPDDAELGEQALRGEHHQDRAAITKIAQLQAVVVDEHDRRVAAEQRAAACDAARVAAIRDRTIAQHVPPALALRAGGYHLVQLSCGVELVTPYLLDAIDAWLLFERAATPAVISAKSVRALRALQHNQRSFSPLFSSIVCPSCLRLSVQADIPTVHRTIALHHHAHLHVSIDDIFSTYGIYVKPFLPDGQWRSHMDDRSAALLQPTVLSARNGCEVSDCAIEPTALAHAQP